MNKQEYIDHITFEMNHRKKWLRSPVMNKRYIRGIITHKIKEQLHSRASGQRTTDPIIRARVIAKTRGVCYLCLRKWNPAMADILPRLYFKTIQIDHIVPFSAFGPNNIANYLVTCSQCNNRKSDLSLAEYRAARAAYKKY